MRPYRSRTISTISSVRPISLICPSAFAGASPTRGRLAAFLGEEGDQLLHAGVVGGVDDAPSLASRADQPGMAELREVEGEGGGRDAQRLRDVPRGHAPRTLPDQQPEDLQPRI